MQEEIFTITAGGMQWTAFTKAEVEYGAEHAVRTFNLEVSDSTEPIGEQWNFMPGTEVSVAISGDLAVTGFINQLTPSYAPNTHSVSVKGSSKGKDSVDSSADHKAGEWRNKTLLDVANDLDQQNVGFTSSANLQPMEVFRLHQGETVFEAIDRAARKQQLLLIGQPDGSIEIAEGGTTSVHAPLIEGFNIIEAAANFNDGHQHRVHKVRGQRALKAKIKDYSVEGDATNTNMTRNRVKIIHPETDVKDKKEATTRAEAHRDRSKGEGITAHVKVQSARCDNGILWVPNTLIYVSSPMLKLDMQMLIKSVHIIQENQGTFSTLSLVHPKAFGSSAPTGSKTSDTWSDDDNN